MTHSDIWNRMGLNSDMQTNLGTLIGYINAIHQCGLRKGWCWVYGKDDFFCADDKSLSKLFVDFLFFCRCRFLG
jgi:hypothetical protein